MKSRVVLVAVIFAVAACSAKQGRGPSHVATDDRKPVVAAKLMLPAYPRATDLAEFHPTHFRTHRYFIDAKSLTVGGDGVVRYTVVVKTSGGATNVSYEGIRCATQERRLFAMGHPDKRWIEAKYSTWQPIRPGRLNEYQAVLSRDYFCPDRTIVSDQQAALRALSSGLDGTAERSEDR